MKTNPIADSLVFLIGGTSDYLNLGNWRFVFMALFIVLLIASVLVAVRVWQELPEQQRGTNIVIWLSRVLIGIMWFQGCLWKLPLPVSGALKYWTGQMVDNAAFAFIGGLVHAIALPNMATVTPIIFLLELGLAISFILGLFVRTTATIGALYAIGLWLGLYRHPSEWPWEYIFLAVAQAQFALLDAGARLGLDALIRSPRVVRPAPARLRTS